jgi:hypothetical protein
MFAHQLHTSGRLAVSQDEARDLLWTLNSPQVYELFVQRGWHLARYQQFLADTWTHALITDERPDGHDRSTDVGGADPAR